MESSHLFLLMRIMKCDLRLHSYKIDNQQDFLPPIEFDRLKDVSFAYDVFIFILLPSFSFSSICFLVFHVDFSL
jgi:hypothetical protein